MNHLKMLKIAPLVPGETWPADTNWEQHNLAHAPWPAFDYTPEVSFSMAHDGQKIYLIFRVREKNIRAISTGYNGEVWKDSCVEFFTAPSDDGLYYNFEFNCIGAVRLSVGTGRHHRRMASAEVLDKIWVKSSLGNQPFEEKSGDFEWTLMAVIPLDCFFEHSIPTLDGRVFKGNFYKCGDALSTPHYVVWNPIETSNPDYHTPQFFAKIEFAAVT